MLLQIAKCPDRFALTGKKKQIYWVSPTAVTKDDLVVREWQLAAPIKLDGSYTVQPGIGLLSYAWRRCGTRHMPSEGLASACDGMPVEDPALMLNLVGWIVEHAALQTRIVFTIPWNVAKGQEDARVLPGSGGTPPLRLLKTVSARNFIGDELDSELALYKDAVWIIGGSYRESRDVYATSIGLMPGAVIIINGIHSLLTFGLLEEPGIGWHVAIAVLAIVIGAAIFAINIGEIGHGRFVRAFEISLQTVLGLLVVVFLAMVGGYFLLREGV